MTEKSFMYQYENLPEYLPKTYADIVYAIAKEINFEIDAFCHSIAKAKHDEDKLLSCTKTLISLLNEATSDLIKIENDLSNCKQKNR